MLTTREQPQRGGDIGSAQGPAPLALARPHQVAIALLLVIGPLAGLASFVFPILSRPLSSSGIFHVIIAGSAALLGVFLSLLVLQAARRARDSRVLIISLTLLFSALIFLIHASSTPGIFFQNIGSVAGFSAQLSLIVAGLGFGLSGLEISPALNRWITRHTGLVLLIVIAAWMGIAWALLFQPSLAVTAASPAASQATDAHDHTGTASEPAQASPAIAPRVLPDLRPLLALGMIGYGFGGWQHYRMYRRSPSQLGLAFVCGIALFGSALLLQRLSTTFSPLFWLYHAFELSGFGVISAAVLDAYRRGLTDETLLESLFLANTRARIEANYAHAFDDLICLLASGERPTALQRQTLRERFGMGDGQVQVLEHAATAVAQERQQRAELEHLNSALRQLEQDKEQLTQMVVHDLKNPLTALVGFLEILKMDRLTPDQSELVDRALRSGRSLAGLIEDLLDIAQIREGKLVLNRTSIAALEIAEECADELRVWADQEQKIIRTSADGALTLYADARLLRRVLLNLISNAIKHTPPGTGITVHASQNDNGWIVYDVCDDGPGIPPDRIESIFERFARGDGSHSTRQQSTGLGLNFCRMVAEAHGGMILVESRVGHGTTFRVLLPGPPA